MSAATTVLIQPSTLGGSPMTDPVMPFKRKRGRFTVRTSHRMARRRMHRTRSSCGLDATGPDCRCAALCACDHCRAPRDRRPVGCGRSLRPLRAGRDRHAAHATRAGQPPLGSWGGEVTPARSPRTHACAIRWPCARLGPGACARYERRGTGGLPAEAPAAHCSAHRPMAHRWQHVTSAPHRPWVPGAGGRCDRVL
jgi:hypothetical protein